MKVDRLRAGDRVQIDEVQAMGKFEHDGRIVRRRFGRSPLVGAFHDGGLCLAGQEAPA